MRKASTVPPRSFAHDHDLIIRAGRGALSLKVNRRTLLASAALLCLCLFVLIVSVMTGDYPISLQDTLLSLTGHADEMISMIVVEWRLPRALLAILVGSALGISGAIFQSLTANPLGSPDVIGFSAGAHTGALCAMLLFAGGYNELVAGALIGGLVTASLVYLLTYKSGIDGFRLIVIGIAVAAMLSAMNIWLIRRAELQVAMAAATWASGSLNGLGFNRLIPSAAASLPLIGAALCLSRPMRQLELGQDLAMSSGVPVNLLRLCLAFVGVALVAVSTAAVGPIAFVALAAPQLARKLSPAGGTALVPAALMGALLLLVADWFAQHAFGMQLPVGIMTFNIGGLYFLWLLIREARK